MWFLLIENHLWFDLPTISKLGKSKPASDFILWGFDVFTPNYCTRPSYLLSICVKKRLVAQWIRVRVSDTRCRGFKSLLAYFPFWPSAMSIKYTTKLHPVGFEPTTSLRNRIMSAMQSTTLPWMHIYLYTLVCVLSFYLL